MVQTGDFSLSRVGRRATPGEPSVAAAVIGLSRFCGLLLSSFPLDNPNLTSSAVAVKWCLHFEIVKKSVEKV